MKYKDILLSKLGLQLLGTGNSLSTLVTTLFSHFIELVEEQIHFLHKNNNIYTADSLLVLSTFLRAEHISVNFNSPPTFKLNVALKASTPTIFNACRLNKGTLLSTGTGTVIVAEDTYFDYVPSTSLINSSVVVQSLTPERVRTLYLGLEEFEFEEITLDSFYVYSDSVSVRVGDIVWSKVTTFADWKTNCYVVTLDLFGKTMITFPVNKPTNTVTITYNEIGSDELKPFSYQNLLVDNAVFDAYFTIVESYASTTLPTVAQLKNTIIYERKRKSSFTIADVRQLINSIPLVTACNVKVISESEILAEVDSTLALYTLNTQIQAILEPYKTYSLNKIIVRKKAATKVLMELKIYGYVTENFESSLKAYFINRLNFTIGDLYEIIEANVVGGSSIKTVSIAPLVLKGTNNLNITIFKNTLTTKSYFYCVATSLNTYTLLDVDKNQIANSDSGELLEVVTSNGVLKVSINPDVTFNVGDSYLFVLYPDLNIVGELELDDYVTLDTINIL